MKRLIGIMVTVLPDSDAQAALVVERLSHVLTGLAMEDIDSDITITPYQSDEEEV